MRPLLFRQVLLNGLKVLESITDDRLLDVVFRHHDGRHENCRNSLPPNRNGSGGKASLYARCPIRFTRRIIGKLMLTYEGKIFWRLRAHQAIETRRDAFTKMSDPHGGDNACENIHAVERTENQHRGYLKKDNQHSGAKFGGSGRVQAPQRRRWRYARRRKNRWPPDRSPAAKGNPDSARSCWEAQAGRKWPASTGAGP